MGRMLYGTAYNGFVRFSIIDSKDIVEEVRSRHFLSYLPTVVLGRLITASSLLIPWLSEKETITFIITSDGPAESVVAQSTSSGTVRGYIRNTNFELEPNSFGKFDVKKAIGNGELTVVRDAGLKVPYVSKVPIISGEIAEDVAYYYTKSEQIPTAFALGVLMNSQGILKAGGLTIQILSNKLSESIIQEIEDRLKNFSITSEMKNMNLEGIAKYILGDENMIFEEMNVEFRCNCNRQRALEALKLLDFEELLEMKKEGKAEIVCKWCNTQYTFDALEIQSAINEKNKKEE